MTRFLQKRKSHFPCNVFPDTNDSGLAVAWVLKNQGGSIQDITYGGAGGTFSGDVSTAFDRYVGYHGMFDGSSGYVDVGATGATIQTAVITFRPETTTEYPLDLNGTASVTVSGGTLGTTGWAAPTTYVNGLTGSTVAAKQWQQVVVTSGTGISASNLDIGRVGANYYEGRIAVVELYTDEKSAEWVAQKYQGLASGGVCGAEGVYPSLAAESSGGFLGEGSSPWWIESGTWQISEESDTTKVIENVTVGDIWLPSSDFGFVNNNDGSFGSWGWWQYKPAAASLTVKIIGTDYSAGANGYAVYHATDEALTLTELGVGTVVDGGTVTADAWHYMFVTRRNFGEFELWVDGVSAGTTTNNVITNNLFMVISAGSAAGCKVIWADPRGQKNFSRYQGDYQIF